MQRGLAGAEREPGSGHLRNTMRGVTIRGSAGVSKKTKNLQVIITVCERGGGRHYMPPRNLEIGHKTGEDAPTKAN